jgi:hypothetical protein
MISGKIRRLHLRAVEDKTGDWQRKIEFGENDFS